MTVPEIIQELNLENGSNYKMSVLKKYKDNTLLQKVLKMTYDKVVYTFGISMKNIKYNPEANYAGLEAEESIQLFEALNWLETQFVTRNITGNAALDSLTDTLERLSKDDAKILEGIINRDLRINMGRSNINKIFKNLIVKPPYMRCNLYSEKTAKKINYPAFVQVKCDGMFCAVQVEQGSVIFNSRSGEEKELPHLEKEFKHYKDGVYIGELLVQGIENRSLANGVLNSDDSKELVYIQLWDYISLDEYSRGKDKNNKTFYKERLYNLQENIIQTNCIQLVETYQVQNVQEALKFVSKWMNDGLEGGILKDKNNIFVDHTSPTQLKLKLEISAEMRVTGFIEGKKGTKRELTFGSLVFENDEGTIKGSTSGFDDKTLKEINDNREKWIGKVIEVQFNDITKSRDKETYSLSHPRYIADRSDEKNETDTLAKVNEMKQMAMELK